MTRNAGEDSYLLEIRRIPAERPAEGSRDAYDEIYSEAGLSHMPGFYAWYLDLMQPHPGDRLLDVSCGKGELVRLAGQRGAKALGVDISRVAARVAGRYAGRYASFGVCDAERLPFADDSFDLISNIGSLEHYLHPEQGAREMARVLRPGGRAVVLLPNTFGLLTTVWTAFRQGITYADEQPIQRYGARFDWARLLERNGLRIAHTTKYEQVWPRSRADWSHYLRRRPKDFVRLLVTPILPLNLASCFVFTCRKAPAAGPAPGEWR